MVSRTRIRDCKDVVELLTEYLEGGLAADAVVRLEKHLGLCDACGEFLATLRRTRAAVRGLAATGVPDDCRRTLRALLDTARRAPSGAPAAVRKASASRPRRAAARPRRRSRP